MHKINIKRIYDKPFKTDGVRILVDRLWPRGISKDKAKLDFGKRKLLLVQNSEYGLAINQNDLKNLLKNIAKN